MDAAGFTSLPAGSLFREGNGIPAITATSPSGQISFQRDLTSGTPKDSGFNENDFIFVSPAIETLGSTPRLGAAAPENLDSPVQLNATVKASLIDPGCTGMAVNPAAPTACARERNTAPVTNGALGTLSLRRRFTNMTGAPVTRLRFRVTDLSTNPAAAGEADLRARSTAAIVVSTAAGNKTVQGTTLEQPPSQPGAGGVNSTLSAGGVTLATPVPNGASVNLRFLFGVQQTGDYDIAFVLEAQPGTGKDIWKLSGHTENGGHNDGGCNKPPVANAGADITAECAGGQAAVTLDGSASADPDGDTPLAYEWKEGATVLGTTQTLLVSLPTGSHTVTL
jgi:hypothetical protein